MMIETSTNHSKASVHPIVIDMTDGYSESKPLKRSKKKRKEKENPNALSEKPEIKVLN